MRSERGRRWAVSTGIILFLSVVGPAAIWGASGDLKWESALEIGIWSAENPVSLSPVIGDDGTVYLGSGDSSLRAVRDDGDKGAVKWRFATDGPVFSPAIGADKRLYLTTSAGRLYAVEDSGDGGTQKWTLEINEAISAPPAIGSDGTIYITTSAGKLYAVEDNEDEGTQKWDDPFSADGSISAPPAIASDGTVYIGTSEGNLYAVQSDGTEKWDDPFKADGSISAPPAIGSDGTVYIGTSEGNLYAVLSGGTAKWDAPFSADGAISASPVIASDGTIYIGTSEGNLYAVQSGGTEKWDAPFSADGGIPASPVIGSDNKIYFGASDGKAYALYSDGEQVSGWPVQISPDPSSPVIVHDGTLYIGAKKETTVSGSVTTTGLLYAVETDAEGIYADAPWPVFQHDIRHTGRNTANQGPTADAGEDQEAVNGETVTLDGSGSTDPDYGIATYSWRQTSGESVTLEDSDTLHASFTAPSVDGDEAALTFELTVTDQNGATDTDTITVNVEEDDSFCFIRAGMDRP